MPDSSNNNTTGLSENGTIGTRDFKSMTATMLSTEVSRHNYQTMSDAKLDEFRQTVYKLVSTWELESKLRILSEYGDASFLKKNASVDDINKQVTETLIVHLSPNDLRQLVSDTYVSERKLKQEVKKAQTQRRKAGTGFNTKTFTEIAEVSRGADTTKQILAAIRTVDNDYSIPKDILSQFKRLRKELKDVLETCFNKTELGAVAAQMGIEIRSSDAKYLMKAIINKTILYVALITGKSKSANIANAFVDSEPYNNLLQYTSYSYITGKPGMSANEWSKLKNRARRAKAQVQVVSRLRKERAKKTDSEFLRLSGGASSTKDIALNDNGILADASYDQLLELAGRYGIDIKKRSIGDLKLELYRAIAADNNRRSRISGIIGRAEARGRFGKRELYDELSIRSSYSPMGSTSNTGSGGNPIVKFDDSGNLKTKSILSAVPVYIVGNGIPGTTPEGAKLGKKILGAISDGNTDVSIKSVTQLDPKDLSLYNQILAMDKAALANQQSILEDQYGVRDVIFMAISDKSLTYKRNAIAWLTASCMKRPKLASYIYNKYNIRFTNYRKFGAENKKAAVGILRKAGIGAGVLGGGAAAIALGVPGIIGAGALGTAGAITTAIIRNMKSAKAKSVDELAQNEQDFYYGLRKISIDDLMNAVSQYYNRAITQRYLDKIKDENKKDYLIALLARKKGYNNLYRFLFRKIGADKTVIPQNQGKNFSNVKAWFSRVFKANNFFQNAFGKKGRTSNADEGLVNPEDNTGKSPADLSRGSVKSTIVGVEMTRPQYKKIHVVEDVTSLVKKQNDGKAKKSEKETKDPHLLAVRTFDVTSTATESVKVSDASSTAESLGINSVLKKAATPVYVINSKLNTSDDSIRNTINNNFTSLFAGLATETVAAPMGAGIITRPLFAVQYAKNKIQQAADILADVGYTKNILGITANTGAKITRMPTGGTLAITGDAAGSNIFANGAKPELVTSTGDMTVKPLKKSKDVSQKVNRMTQAERSSALATSISSHIIRMAYNLPSGISDLSNPGEAIKVYNVKPGITDQISIGNGQTTSLIGLLGSIYSQLIAINSGATVGNQLLTTIAANTTITKAASSTTSSGNPFAGGFPTNLDAILQGE